MALQAECGYDSNGGYVCGVAARILNLRRPYLQRPAGTFRVLAFCPQDGGGLAIWGTATLTNTNVYENVADVRLHFEPS